MSLCTVSACCGGGGCRLLQWWWWVCRWRLVSAVAESAMVGGGGDRCSLATESCCGFAVARGSGIQYCI